MMVCLANFEKCPQGVWMKSQAVAELIAAPFKLWKWAESYIFPYHWFLKNNPCLVRETI
jgi:hypothetical protein